MRGENRQTTALFSYVRCEARVPSDHPLRLIRAVVDEALDVSSPKLEALWECPIFCVGLTGPCCTS
jgi:hypothetical protein